MDGEERPDELRTWTDLCDVVDTTRIAINRDLLRAIGLTLAENLVLCQVAMAPGPRLRMAHIAGSLTIGKSAVTKTVDRLERRGLITRERDPADRRVVYAALTRDGARMFTIAQPEFTESVKRHFAGRLSSAQLRQARRLASQVLRADREAGPALSPGATAAPVTGDGG